MASTNKLINIGGGRLIDADNNFHTDARGFSRISKSDVGTSVNKMLTNMLTQQNAVGTVRKRLQQKLEKIKKKAGK